MLIDLRGNIISPQTNFGEISPRCLEHYAKSMEKFATERSLLLDSFEYRVLDSYGHPFKKVGSPTTIKFRRYNTFNKKEE